MAVPSTITAQRFVLTDAAERSRAELAMAEDGPVLAFYDAGGTPRIKLGMTQDTSGLIIYDESGRRFAKLEVREPGLILYNEQGQPAAALGVHALGGSLVLYDYAGVRRVLLGMDPVTQSPRLTVFNPNGEVVWSAS